MDSSRRAVESYWRSRMIDAATSDEDKVAPVYKLEEICELLRSSHVSIVKEVVDFLLKRLDHKSPIVKQKALRVIKYTVGKSGVDFRREMQRHSVAVRNLIHYRGQPDPLKGDALNKAVRETAQEAITALFAVEDSNNKPAPVVGIGKKMEGFGSTNYVVHPDENKSFLSEVVDLGTATIKQGFTSLAQGRGLSGMTQVHMPKKNESGSYRAPNLRRSLTTEIEYSDNRYEPAQYEPAQFEKHGSFGSSSNVGNGSWNSESRAMKSDIAAGDLSSRHIESKTREEHLLDTIATNGGVRLQPTRDAIQAFLLEAAKVDAVALSHAIEKKLQSPQWQVRVKAICVLDPILRKNEDEHFSIVASYFTENKDVLVSCSESPQASLRERAVKVLKLLGGEPTNGLVTGAERQTQVETKTTVQMPDLIDTGDGDNFTGEDSAASIQIDQSSANVNPPVSPLIDDLFGDSLGTSGDSSDQKNVDDPFADVLFHSSERKEHPDDLFSGMTVDEKGGVSETNILSNQNNTEVFDIFGSNSGVQEHGSHKGDVDNLMAGLLINDKQKENYSPKLSGSTHLQSHSNGKTVSDSLSGLLDSQAAGMNSNTVFHPSTLPYSLPPGVMLNSAYPHTMNNGAMGNHFAQQQLLATMSNLQHFSNLGTQSTSINQVATNSGGNPAPLPDIFQPNYVAQMPSSTISSKEETKAFDFISERLASARDTKRVV